MSLTSGGARASVARWRSRTRSSDARRSSTGSGRWWRARAADRRVHRGRGGRRQDGAARGGGGRPRGRRAAGAADRRRGRRARTPRCDDLLAAADRRAAGAAAPQRRALAAALLLEDADGPVDPRLVGWRCRSLLDAIAGPVVLAIDDWQWLDAATAAVLTFVLRRLEPGGAKVIATVRSGEADEALAAPGAQPAGGARAGAGARAARRRGARPARPRAHGRVAVAARAGAPARGVRRQPADGAGAGPRARRRARRPTCGGCSRAGVAALPPDSSRRCCARGRAGDPDDRRVGRAHRASRRRWPPTSSSATATGCASPTR